ncbi:MAG: hypothetical protein ABS76_07575 [Pelagibacterium sp. SCN 64-44]|nr:MAG: hypothetical protein ABS76_07575 [Pelagibacterium sp. SCN 64-44]
MSIDWQTLDSYMGQIAEAGVSAIAVNLVATEGGSLSEAERLESVTRTKAAAGGACPVISGVIASYTDGAVETAKRLVDAGADALVVFPALPVFASKPLPIDVIVDYHRAVAEATDKPILGFQTSNVEYPRGTVAALSDIPNLVAVKDAGFNIEKTAEMVDEVAGAKRKIGLMTGNDTFILEALLLGCDGALIGYAGTATAELIRMQRLAAVGKATEAYEIWYNLGPLARFIWSAPLRDFRPRMKYVLYRQGVIPNYKTRAPQPEISAHDRKIIDQIMDKHGLDDEIYMPAGRRHAQQRSAS